MGIEPTLFAWEARVLPLNDTRDGVIVGFSRDGNSSFERRHRCGCCGHPCSQHLKIICIGTILVLNCVHACSCSAQSSILLATASEKCCSACGQSRQHGQDQPEVSRTGVGGRARSRKRPRDRRHDAAATASHYMKTRSGTPVTEPASKREVLCAATAGYADDRSTPTPVEQSARRSLLTRTVCDGSLGPSQRQLEP